MPSKQIHYIGPTLIRAPSMEGREVDVTILEDGSAIVKVLKEGKGYGTDGWLK